MEENYSVCGVDLKKIQSVQLCILEEVDRICKKNDIKYFLSGGTLLGAVRHHGFIPWDDDIDLWMTRKNYKKFKRALKKELSSQYYYLDYFKNKRYPLSIMKIEKKGTRYIEEVFSTIGLESGIYIDIFPLDNICLPFYKLQTAILIKCQAIRDYKLRKDGKEKAGTLKKIFYGCCPLWLCRTITEITMRFFNIFPTKYKNQLCHRGRYWPKFSKEDVENLIQADFCGKKYPIPANYDDILKKCYGDYMKLPPIEKQQPIHDIIECKLSEED